jgi:hypothetical protein
MSKIDQTGRNETVNLAASPAGFGIYPVTESSGTLPPNARKHHDFVPTISDRY